MRAWKTLAAFAAIALSAACTSPTTGDDGNGAGNDGDGTGTGGTGGGGTKGDGPPSNAEPLGPTTFVFVQTHGDDDWVVAMDYVTKSQTVLAKLQEGSVSGWNIDGLTVSPDRRSIVIATGFGATSEDVAQGSSYNNLIRLDADGANPTRISPVYPHATANHWIDVRAPAFSPDGARVYYQHYEQDSGDLDSIYGAVWSVPSDGSSPPSLLRTPLEVTCGGTGSPFFEPTTGDIVVEHAVCRPSSDEGLYRYGVDGTQKGKLLDTAPFTVWDRGVYAHDGSAFLFGAFDDATGVGGLYVAIPASNQLGLVVVGDERTIPSHPALSPDDSHIVYCLLDIETNTRDLHLLDLTTDDLTDTPLTTDGVSCSPTF